MPQECLLHVYEQAEYVVPSNKMQLEKCKTLSSAAYRSLEMSAL
jgi:hypothetical protein